MRIISGIALAGSALLLSACVSMPTGPGVMVLPGSGKNFDQFRADDADCRQFASSQVGGATPDQVAANSGVQSAVVGTVIGAAAGALIGGSSGAAAGAAAGLVIGGAAGAGAGASSQYSLQQRYDVGYQQCMYSKGNKVPMAGGDNGYARRPRAAYAPPPPPQYGAGAPSQYGAPPPPPAAGAIPPPPPGAPPPPPPGVR